MQESINSGTTDFSQIVRFPNFIDKTLLIRELLQNNRTAVITAPPKFGKSTNLDMIQRFLEIEVDSNGVPTSKANCSDHPIIDTQNYKLFVGNKLKITQDTKMMHDLLGRTPVLYVSLKDNIVIKDTDDVLRYFKNIVHLTYKRYLYLSRSDRLGVQQRENVGRWCDACEHLQSSQQQVYSALRQLAECLHRHFGQRKVFVLIDDHDYALRTATDVNALNDVVHYIAAMTNALLKNNRLHVLGGLMTGVWSVPAVGTPAHNAKHPDSFQVYRFLDDHRFMDFYGLTGDEVEALLVGNGINCTFDDVTAKYNGYTRIKSTKLYNIYSVLRFLKTGNLENYWTRSNDISYIGNVICEPYIRNNITELVSNQSVYIDAIDQVSVNDIIYFKNLTVQRSANIMDISRAFSLLFAEGYLTYKSGVIIQIDKETPKVGVRCPNDEIKEYFNHILKQYAYC